MDIFEICKVYKEFQYPMLYINAIQLNLVDFDFWYIMSAEQVDKRINGLLKRYPHRKLIPFARRDDCDDIACFEVGKGSEVQIIHDFADEGYEQRNVYSDFGDWMKAALDEFINGEK